MSCCQASVQPGDPGSWAKAAGSHWPERAVCKSTRGAQMECWSRSVQSSPGLVSGGHDEPAGDSAKSAKRAFAERTKDRCRTTKCGRSYTAPTVSFALHLQLSLSVPTFHQRATHQDKDDGASIHETFDVVLVERIGRRRYMFVEASFARPVFARSGCKVARASLAG